MANWIQVYREDLKLGKFYDQGVSEVTLPRGFRVVWRGRPSRYSGDHPYKCPEMDITDRDTSQPEVKFGRSAGVGLCRMVLMNWYMISVRLILQCNADIAAEISAGYYDDLIVEQDLGEQVFGRTL